MVVLGGEFLGFLDYVGGWMKAEGSGRWDPFCCNRLRPNYNR